MLRPGLSYAAFVLFVCRLAAAPAAAQQQGVEWQHEIESAQRAAQQSGRLVLVHFWTPECGPCLMLDQHVYNQPGVAGAIQSQFVPVKLNANENPAIAQRFGITRVPTDVILAPDGQVVGKLISPPTPSAYIAEISQVATQYAQRSSGTLDGTVAAAPSPSQLNAAYANLPVNSITPPVAPASPTTSGAANDPYQIPFVAPALPAMSDALTSPAEATAARPPAGNYASSPASTAPIAPPAIVTNQFAASDAAAPAASSPAADAVPPNASRLPPGAPPLGFEGFCPVSMRNSNLTRWVAGNPQWGAIHRGRTYWFAGSSEQQQFLANPDYYAPALSGLDAVLAIDHRQQVPGRREHSIDYDNVFYFFSSEATLQQFTVNPERYAAGARQAMGLERGRLVR